MHKGANFLAYAAIMQAYNLGAIMTINLIKPSLALLAEYVSGNNEYVRFFDGGIVHTFFDGELEIVKQSQDFFDFVASVVKGYYSSYNLVDNWQEINDCFDLFESMDNSQKVLFAHVLADYSYSYDLPTLTNYVLENACLFEGSAYDYACEVINDCYNVKSMGFLANYIDYDSFARDMFLNGEIIELGYNLYWTNPGDI